VFEHLPHSQAGGASRKTRPEERLVRHLSPLVDKKTQSPEAMTIEGNLARPIFY